VTDQQKQDGESDGYGVRGSERNVEDDEAHVLSSDLRLRLGR